MPEFWESSQQVTTAGFVCKAVVQWPTQPLLQVMLPLNGIAESVGTCANTRHRISQKQRTYQCTCAGGGGPERSRCALCSAAAGLGAQGTPRISHWSPAKGIVVSRAASRRNERVAAIAQLVYTPCRAGRFMSGGRHRVRPRVLSSHSGAWQYDLVNWIELGRGTNRHLQTIA